MGKLHNPHDLFFKTMMSDLGAAKVYLQCYLPNEVIRQLDLSTLRITDNSFVTDELSGQFADLILECRLRTDNESSVWIAFLYEHKSHPEKYALFQVGQYMFSGYNQQISNKISPLKLIIPVIYYHGSEKFDPGRITNFFDHQPENFKIFLPDFDYIFQDITLLTDEEIQQLEHHLLVPGMLMQKYFRDLNKLKNILEIIFRELNMLEDKGNYKKRYFVYLFDLFDNKENELMKAIDEIEYPTKDKTKNYILQLEEKGMKKAIAKMLRKELDTEFICDTMDVTPEYVERIRKTYLSE